MLKKFLILTGAAAAGIEISILLHNAVYALCTYFFGDGFWKGGDEPVLFVIGIIICPLGFLTGSVGSIFLAVRRLRAAEKSPARLR